MKTMDALITNIINNIIHGLWFYSLVLEPKHSKKKLMAISAGTVVFLQLFVILFSVVMRRSGLFQMDNLFLKKIYFGGYCVTALIWGIIFVCLLSASEPVKSLFLMSAYYSFWTLVYLIISIITNTFAGAGGPVIWGLRIGLNLPVLLLYHRLFKRKIQRMYQEVQIGYEIVAAVSFFAFLVMTTLIIYNESVEGQGLFYTVMILSVGSMMVIIHVLLFRFIAQSDYANRLKQMQLHEKYLRAQIDSYVQMEQSARQTRHDIRHHNMVVAEYAKEKNYQGILSYLQEYETLEEEKYEGAFCKNHVINNVLRAYVNKAKRDGIEVNMDIRLGDAVKISDYDLVSILANILENAVNACGRETGKKQIEVSLRQKGSKLILVCKNTCTAEVQFKDGIPDSKERIGVGISSVQSSVEKYGGCVRFSTADGIFICQVIMNNAENRKKGEGGSMLC